MFCGTPLLDDLYEAREAFHAGRPIDNGVIVDEIILNIHSDWELRGRNSTMDGWEDIYYPRTNIEGGAENIPMLFPETIEGFFPERDHEYRLRARRFSINQDLFFSLYEPLEVLSDKAVEG